MQFISFEPRHSKSYNLQVCPAETKIYLRSLISLQWLHDEVTLGSAIYRMHIAKAQYDQTVRMHTLI